MNEYIKQNISKGNIILFLGAGASCSSKNKHDDYLLLGDDLAKDMARYFHQPYQNESLQEIYSSLKFNLKDRVNEYFECNMRYCTPSSGYNALSLFPWRRIYTINIDDAFDIALLCAKTQDVNICSMTSRYKERDQTYSRLDYVKLHGSVDRLQEGVIFSPDEYADISAQPHHWYSMLPQDYMDSIFLFIGTKANESALLKVINDFKIRYKTRPGKHYLIIPEATQHQANSLLANYNIEYIQGDIDSFVMWLKKEFPAGLTPSGLFSANNPGLIEALATTKPNASKSFSPRELEVLTSVSLLNDAFFSNVSTYAEQSIEHDFYTGIKPTWIDIKSKIPAELHTFQSFFNAIQDNIKNNIRISALIGQAGSGKLTTLMQVAELFSKQIDIPTYFYDNSFPLDEVITALNSIHDKYLLFIDKISNNILQLENIIRIKNLDKCFIACTERKNIWKKICENKLSHYFKVLDMGKITKDDALRILDKLERYGRWTRLSMLTQPERINEFMDRSDKQLLIALMEATHGKGFQDIIEDDYNRIDDQEERSFLNIVGLFTLHNNTGIKRGNAFNSLLNLYPECSPEAIFSNLSGIIYDSGNYFYARHPLYIDHLFTHITNKHKLAESIVSIIKSFSAYDVPYAKSLDKKDYYIFKSILNNRFLRYRISDQAAIFDIFTQIGKQLENDGHYWLQYGLSLKYYRLYEEAHDKLETSISIYDQPYSRHALAILDMLLALKAKDQRKANLYFTSGKEALETLDSDPRHRYDWYPIISLAEGEVKYADKFLGVDIAKEKARYYSNIIADRKKKMHGNKYLERAWTYIATYATNGIWSSRSFLEDDIVD